MEAQNLLPYQGDARYYSSFFSEKESNGYFETLQAEVAWKQEPVRIMGKSVMQPRLTAWYGDQDKSYTYSGITMFPLSWTETLKKIKTAVEDLVGLEFTSALLNYYRDGKDYMGWHRDNEKILGNNPVIASVSFGAPRMFQFRLYADKKLVRTILLEHGSLLIAKGETQQYWQHRLPKLSTPTLPRINITFRVLH